MSERRALNLRLRPDDQKRLDLATEHYGIEPADVIRMLLKREADRISKKIAAEIQTP